MMTLPLDAADRPEQVAGIAGMMLGIGYCIGALAPLALGALRDGTGSFSAGLWAIALAAGISLVCGDGVLARPAGPRRPPNRAVTTLLCCQGCLAE